MVGVGTFRDVTALINADTEGENFDDLDVTRVGRSYLTELGVNAIELLPPADSVYEREWGYGTTNYLAPDFDLGFPLTFTAPAPNHLLAELVRTCHAHGIRFFTDVVLAFAKCNPYLAACDDFFILDPKATPPTRTPTTPAAPTTTTSATGSGRRCSDTPARSPGTIR